MESPPQPDAALAEFTATRHVARAGEQVRRRLADVALSVLTGADAGKRFVIGGPAVPGEARHVAGPRVVVGRAAEHDVVLVDKSISTTHFELTLAEDHVVLRDLGSRNGVWSDKVRLLGQAALADGAEFEAGSCRFRLDWGGTTQVPVSAQSKFADLRGVSLPMRELFATLARLAPKPIKVLIHGESGTGKEEVARAIHQASGRTGPFIVLDCAALPRELAEAKILGYKRGAFTGAATDQPGCFEAAAGGTLLIDEIGELPADLQPKLLRVLQRGEVQRLGEHGTRPVDVRVLAATHRDLRSDIADGRFRFDLYARIAQFVVEIPPLRERRDDIIPLARHFVAKVGAATGRRLELSEEVAEWLSRLHWEGNVRQLQNAVECAAYLADGATIGRGDIVVQDQPGREPSMGDEALLHVPLKDAVARLTSAFMRRYCERVLAAAGGDLKGAAELAGYGERGFRELLGRLDMAAGG